jgi:hypothetical protein
VGTVGGDADDHSRSSFQEVTMTERLPMGRRRIFHVPHGTAYAIENSPAGIGAAVKLLFRWIDMDCHVTQDGVPVLAHWDKIRKDKFEITPAFAEKYGDEPKVTEVLAEDLLTLQTRPLPWSRWRRRRRVAYMTVADAMQRIAAHPRLGLALEAKGGTALTLTDTWKDIEATRDDAGLPKERFMVMTLMQIGGAHARLAAAHEAGHDTVLMPRGRPVPREWEPDITWIRGKWVRA